MNKTWMVILGVLGACALFVMVGISMGNKMVTLDEGVSSSWAQVQNVYQRRMDLVPNLVATVKGYAKHEAEVLTDVTEARARVGQVQVNNAADVKKLEASQAQLSSALSRLMVVVEKYPDLKADRSFLDLQSQLEGTENRISVERGRFNEASRAFNTYIRSFPASVIAAFRGFTPKPYFEADAGAKTAPKVEF